MTPTLSLLASLVAPAAAQSLSIPHEEYQLDNGLNVILLVDHDNPEVVVNIWYGVGGKDELVGRTGFAHLFEHLMFMGTTRLPGSGFDDLMEAEGGWNNAWTSEDATDYYSSGPPELLTTLLWMEADRMEGLAKAMTQEKLDLQREVVRNERRQSYEDSPYGVAWMAMPEVLYPKGHPYAHSVIGSHEDLMAAEVSDVVNFFNSWYVPNNASLVVAGDFDPAVIKPEIARMFGVLVAGELPERIPATTPDVPVVPLTELTDQVQIPMTTMMWHTPAGLAEGDAAFDIIGSLLSAGRTSRLYQRMVMGDAVATEVSAAQYSQLLGSIFMINALPTDKYTLDQLENIVYEEIEKLATDGPTEAELARILAQLKMQFIGGLEALDSRASALNRYRYLAGTPDYVAQDAARYDAVTIDDLKAAAATLTKNRVGIIRVFPETKTTGGDQ